MNIQSAYNLWAAHYDSNENKTRDREAKALRDVVSLLAFKSVLEMGCGTGKNTEWLSQKAAHITSVDLSEEMLSKAKQKINKSGVRFIQADMLQEWDFATGYFDIVIFSLVLEHIENLSQYF